LPVEYVAPAIPILLLVFLIVPIPFDWSGEFAAGIVYAFAFGFSLHLFRFHGQFHRGAAILLAFLYAYGIYGTLAAWISRADSGHPFR